LVAAQSNFAVQNRFAAGVFIQAAVSSGMTNDSIENLARKLADSVPEGLRSMRNDLEENFRAVLKSGLSKLDLVTREEFEVQEAVLKRTREKLEALEARLTEHEKSQ
jgi:BMFP domain-containing protein YqiC